MQPDCDLALHFQQAISAPRLTGYADPADQDLMPAVGRYLWNTALCEALYPPVHGVEIVLRNIVDKRLRVLHGDFWFDDPLILLVGKQKTDLGLARVRLQGGGLPETHDRIVAELGFGFWTGMLAGCYERPVWQTNVRADFPNVPTHRRTRSQIAGRLNDVRALRNRVSHHESIWRRPHLDREYECVVETLEWFSPALRESVRLVDRFPAVLGAGHAAYMPGIEALGKTWKP